MEPALAVNKKCYVYVIDDDPGVLDGLACFIESVGYTPVCYSSAIDFLDELESVSLGCIIADIQMPFMTGVEFHQELMDKRNPMPIIFISGQSDIPIAVDRIRFGAIDFLTKPVNNQRLLDSLNKAFRSLKNLSDGTEACCKLKQVLGELTKRELEVFHFLLDGLSSKHIARSLNISVHTVDVHRSRIFKKMGVTSLSRLILLAGGAGYKKPEK